MPFLLSCVSLGATMIVLLRKGGSVVSLMEGKNGESNPSLLEKAFEFC